MSQNCRFAFAVHVLAVLAKRPDEACSSPWLAQTVNTNPVVIRRLLLDLAHAGFVRTERGPHGGARLRLSPERILLGNVLSSLEGTTLFGMHPRRPLSSCPVGCRIETVLDEVHDRARKALEKELNQITLADVLDRCQKA
ncbi:Rrf2 family transcriptional regulator [bacterium]|nr:Rrf2 family transcriptional regulator [bacterium]